MSTWPEDRGKNDPRYQDAIRAVRESGRASTAMVQRVLVIGYNRAACMIEAMEADGILRLRDCRYVLVTPFPGEGEEGANG